MVRKKEGYRERDREWECTGKRGRGKWLGQRDYNREGERRHTGEDSESMAVYIEGLLANLKRLPTTHYIKKKKQ